MQILILLSHQEKKLLLTIYTMTTLRSNRFLWQCKRTYKQKGDPWMKHFTFVSSPAKKNTVKYTVYGHILLIYCMWQPHIVSLKRIIGKYTSIHTFNLFCFDNWKSRCKFLNVIQRKYYTRNIHNKSMMVFIMDYTFWIMCIQPTHTKQHPL